MPEVYEGDQPYIFLCYTHADKDVVLPIIASLANEYYRLWYDDGIELGQRYPMRIADHVYGCSFFILFVSKTSLGSIWCRDEVNYALDLGKAVLPVFLEDVELTRDLQMRLGYVQSLFWHELSEDAFYSKLFRVRGMDPCLTLKGREHRGVRPRSGALQATEIRLREENARIVSVTGVAPRKTLNDYSWSELKAISRLISEAGSDAEWKTIARKYGFLGEGGKLCVAKKVFRLKNDIGASVRILGLRHDELVSGRKAGISFEFADVPASHAMNSKWTNEGGWKQSEMRSWLNGEFSELLPDELIRNVAVAKKWTNNRGEVSSMDETSVVTATPDRLWLLSSKEVFGNLGGIYNAEGTQYQLFTDRTVTFPSNKLLKKRGADFGWWLRSPDPNDSYSFRFVYFDGRWQRCYCRGYDVGVSPGFCF